MLGVFLVLGGVFLLKSSRHRAMLSEELCSRFKRHAHNYMVNTKSIHSATAQYARNNLFQIFSHQMFSNVYCACGISWLLLALRNWFFTSTSTNDLYHHPTFYAQRGGVAASRCVEIRHIQCTSSCIEFQLYRAKPVCCVG